MLTSVLSLGLLSLIPFVTAQASYTYHGCISGFTSGTAAASGAASVAACNTACSATKYFYYRAAATTPCQCSDTDPYRYSAAEVTFVNSQDSGGTCPSTAVQVSFFLTYPYLPADSPFRSICGKRHLYSVDATLHQLQPVPSSFQELDH